jgi:hypothetical protein
VSGFHRNTVRSETLAAVGNVATLRPAWTFETLRLGLRSVLRALGHMATSRPENEIDCGASQSLEVGIAFLLTDSCQPTVEDVSRQ